LLLFVVWDEVTPVEKLLFHVMKASRSREGVSKLSTPQHTIY